MLEVWAEACRSRPPQKDTHAAAAKRAHGTLEITRIHFRQKVFRSFDFFFIFFFKNMNYLPPPVTPSDVVD